MGDGKKAEKKQRLVSRREFLVGGSVIAAGALVACSPNAISTLPGTTVTDTTTTTATTTVTTTAAAGKPAYPASTGYLLVDHIKCAGCMTCMFACSMAHEGKADPTLSRIQIVQSSFAIFPNDVRQYQCRQCATPVCVQNCPVGACHIDTANGNVRVTDQSICIGCGTCIKSCPQEPHRTIWDASKNKATKCDLCINTPYLGAAGGPGGVQACVAVCPMSAIKFTDTMPDQTGDKGYDVNLRNANAVKIQISEVPEKA